MTKTYVLTLSRLFPSTHPRAGELTEFKEKFLNKQKIHTIRANYPLWRDRIAEINSGRACLSIRQWTGLPYRSKQVEIARLTKEDGIGIEKLRFKETFLNGTPIVEITNETSYANPRPSEERIAYNDGLSHKDWQFWFENYDLSKPMAVIHFTKFRYTL